MDCLVKAVYLTHLEIVMNLARFVLAFLVRGVLTISKISALLSEALGRLRLVPLDLPLSIQASIASRALRLGDDVKVPQSVASPCVDRGSSAIYGGPTNFALVASDASLSQSIDSQQPTLTSQRSQVLDPNGLGWSIDFIPAKLSGAA